MGGFLLWGDLTAEMLSDDEHKMGTDSWITSGDIIGSSAAQTAASAPISALMEPQLDLRVSYF